MVDLRYNLVDIGNRLGRLFGKPADLCRHNRKSAPCIPGTRCLNRSVQCQKAGLRRDLHNRLRQCIDLFHRLGVFDCLVSLHLYILVHLHRLAARFYRLGTQILCSFHNLAGGLCAFFCHRIQALCPVFDRIDIFIYRCRCRCRFLHSRGKLLARCGIVGADRINSIRRCM